jgi:hypothetical protein
VAFVFSIFTIFPFVFYFHILFFRKRRGWFTNKSSKIPHVAYTYDFIFKYI